MTAPLSKSKDRFGETMSDDARDIVNAMKEVEIFRLGLPKPKPTRKPRK